MANHTKLPIRCNNEGGVSMQDRDLRRAAARRAALIIGGMVLALAAVYIAIQLYAILGRTYRTETAIAATMSDSCLLYTSPSPRDRG